MLTQHTRLTIVTYVLVIHSTSPFWLGTCRPRSECHRRAMVRGRRVSDIVGNAESLTRSRPAVGPANRSGYQLRTWCTSTDVTLAYAVAAYNWNLELHATRRVGCPGKFDAMSSDLFLGSGA